MKKMTIFLFCIAAAFSAMYSCKGTDNEPAANDGNYQLNKIVGKINGKDTIADISAIYITNYQKYLNYNLKNQQLSVISAAPANGGLQIDFYANDTTVLKVNKKYYIIDPWHPKLGSSTGYFHKYSAGGGYPQVLSASVSGADYYCIITKLENNVIQGEITYMVNNTLFSGKFYSNKLEYKTSTN